MSSRRSCSVETVNIIRVPQAGRNVEIGDQDDLIQEIAAVDPNTMVVLNTSPWATVTGRRTLDVAASSRDVRLQAEITIAARSAAQ
jgi:hypothetical protein